MMATLQNVGYLQHDFRAILSCSDHHAEHLPLGLRLHLSVDRHRTRSAFAAHLRGEEGLAPPLLATLTSDGYFVVSEYLGSIERPESKSKPPRLRIVSRRRLGRAKKQNAGGHLLITGKTQGAMRRNELRKRSTGVTNLASCSTRCVFGRLCTTLQSQQKPHAAGRWPSSGRGAPAVPVSGPLVGVAEKASAACEKLTPPL